jgi:hypothetical protein
MPTIEYEYQIGIVFAVSFFAALAAEVLWLVRKKGFESLRANAVVYLSGLAGFCFGFGIPFSLILLIVLVVSDTAETTDRTLVTTFACSATGFFVVLLLAKRVFVSVFGFYKGKDAWVYSLATSLLSFSGSIFPPLAFLFLTK